MKDVCGIIENAGREQLYRLYGDRDISGITARYKKLADKFKELYGDKDVRLFSASGRTEIGGNHTDHNRGRVLAAAITMDAAAVVAPSGDNLIDVFSVGFGRFRISLDDASLKNTEKQSAASIIRGIAARMKGLGMKVSGFRAVVGSEVLKGSGLSSSAAFEVLICKIIDELFSGGRLTAAENAKISQYAENVYFGKPSGLMDQMASAHGGLVTIDFKNDTPDIDGIDFDFDAAGYTLAIVDTGGSHAHLTGEYAAITDDMREVAGYFGEEFLRFVPYEKFMSELPSLRKAASDRAILRAIHFFEENERVPAQAEALRRGDLNSFLGMVNDSGRSSWEYLCNNYPASSKERGIPLALALSRDIIGSSGACRVHGGGFAGTILVFMPKEILPEYKKEMSRVFGENSVYALGIRKAGASEII